MGLRVPPLTCSFLAQRELAESGDEEMISPIKGVLNYFKKPLNELPKFLFAYVQLSLKVGDQLFLSERHALSMSIYEVITGTIGFIVCYKILPSVPGSR